MLFFDLYAQIILGIFLLWFPQNVKQHYCFNIDNKNVKKNIYI